MRRLNRLHPFMQTFYWCRTLTAECFSSPQMNDRLVSSLQTDSDIITEPVELKLCSCRYIVSIIIITIIFWTRGKCLEAVAQNYENEYELFDSTPYAGQSSSTKPNHSAAKQNKIVILAPQLNPFEQKRC